MKPAIPTIETANDMDGLLRCSRYAFGPNRLHYCGPDSNPEVKAYIETGSQDAGLAHLLSGFRTMFPYLRLIADENGIADPFDARVVEAYWLGNELLDRIDSRHFYRHLLDDQEMKKRMTAKELGWFAPKIGAGAVPHHSFHVLNIWKRTGHAELEHTLASFDECRVSWGKVIETSGPAVTVETEPVIYENGKLNLGAPIRKKLARRLESEYDIEQLTPGKLVSIHWSVPCEEITQRQAAFLRAYTLKSLSYANETI